LLLSPLAVDELLNATSGVAYLHGCGIDNVLEGQSSRCAHLVLPPQPHELQDPNDISRWRRSALLRIISGWTGLQKENRSVSWWPLRDEDLILYLEPSVLPHPEALKRLVSVIASNSMSLPFSLPISVEYVYHLGWVSREGARESGGGEVFLVNQLSSVGSISTTMSTDFPGSAILTLFGGVDAVMQQRLSQPLSSPAWADNFGHNQSNDVLSLSIDQGIDIRGGVRSLLLLKSEDDTSSAAFTVMIMASLGKSSLEVQNSVTLLTSLDLFSPRTLRSRFHFPCLVGRLGNFFINLLNALALAKASKRVAILRSPEHPKDGIFSRYFQSPHIPWVPFVHYLPRSIPLQNSASENALCINTHEDGFPHACGQDKTLASWVNEEGGVCRSFLSIQRRSSHPYTSPMLQLMGIRESEVLNPDTHPMGTLGPNYDDQILIGSTVLSVQAFNYYDYSFSSAQEWLSIRCALDFSSEVLAEAWALVGPYGSLGGRPFFAVHVRLEDFNQFYPGEDTSPPLEDYIGYAGVLARHLGLQKVFVASNGSPEEKKQIISQFSQMGLLAILHPLSDDALHGKFVDAAVASYASAFLGNKISTYSYLIAGQLLCAGVSPRNITFFRAKAYADEKLNVRT
jgi:hypothetical protein